MGRTLVARHLRQVIVPPDMLEIEFSDDRLLQVNWAYAPLRRRREIVLPAEASPVIRPMKVEDRGRILKATGEGRAWLSHQLINE